MVILTLYELQVELEEVSLGGQRVTHDGGTLERNTQHKNINQ